MMKNSKDLGAILEGVLPELDSIAKAPKCAMDIPGIMEVPRESLESYEDGFRARDRQKWYKAIDSAGNVYRMRNPWSYGYSKPELWQGGSIASKNNQESKGVL